MHLEVRIEEIDVWACCQTWLIQKNFSPFEIWMLSTTVIRQVAFSSDAHLTAPKWEGLTICQILQNTLSKKRISSPKVKLRAESPFSSNRLWKSFFLHLRSVCYGLLFVSACSPHSSLTRPASYRLLFLLVLFLPFFLSVCLLSPTAVLSSVTSALLCHLLHRADVSSLLLHLPTPHPFFFSLLLLLPALLPPLPLDLH